MLILCSIEIYSCSPVLFMPKSTEIQRPVHASTSQVKDSTCVDITRMFWCEVDDQHSAHLTAIHESPEWIVRKTDTGASGAPGYSFIGQVKAPRFTNRKSGSGNW